MKIIESIKNLSVDFSQCETESGMIYLGMRIVGFDDFTKEFRKIIHVILEKQIRENVEIIKPLVESVKYEIRKSSLEKERIEINFARADLKERERELDEFENYCKDKLTEETDK